MEKLKLVLSLYLIFCALDTGAAEFKLLGEQKWGSEEKIDKTKLGGLSGLILRNDKVYLISDDRGLVQEPRLYEFAVEKSNSIWKLTKGQPHFLKLQTAKITEVLDPESLVGLPSENFLIASEGDNNKKPRVPPRIFEVTSNGKYVKDLELPSMVVPEKTGQQKKGVSNNFALEAMTLSKDGESLWFTTEKPLVQDSSVEDSAYRHRLFHMNLKTGKTEQFYFENPPPDSKAEGILLAGGWTEMIHLGDRKFWFLERTLRLAGGKNLQYSCRLAEVDFEKSSEVSALPSLLKAATGEAKLISATFNKIHRLETKDQPLGNCEGMVIGPASGDFKQTLWVITDNNFSKNTDTILSFFGVKD